MFLKEFFEDVFFEKKSADDNKSMKNYPACIELRFIIIFFVTAEFPPKICLESDSAAAGACILFSNVTSHIDIAAENHKIHLSGCMELALTLFNKTLSDFPVSCFKIPGDEKEHEDKANNFGNFMP